MFFSCWVFVLCSDYLLNRNLVHIYALIYTVLAFFFLTDFALYNRGAGLSRGPGYSEDQCRACVRPEPRPPLAKVPMTRLRTVTRGSATEGRRWRKAVTSGDPYRGPGGTLPGPHTVTATEPFHCLKGFSTQFSTVHLQTLRHMNLDQLVNLWKKNGSWDYDRYGVESVDEFRGYWHFNTKFADSRPWHVYLLNFLSTRFYSFRV